MFMHIFMMESHSIHQPSARMLKYTTTGAKSFLTHFSEF